MTRYELRVTSDELRVAVSGPQSSVLSPQSSVLSLRSSISGPQSSVFSLRSSVSGPRSPVLGLPSSFFRLPSSVFRLRSSACVLAALLVVAGWALAQPAQSGSSPMSQAPVFKYYVWGQVRGPGAYSLGANPDLLELLSAAGGPTEYADVRHVVLVRATTQKRMNINLKKMLDAGQVVPLSPGDVVMVPNSLWYRIRDGISIVTTISSFATLVVSIMIYTGVGK